MSAGAHNGAGRVVALGSTPAIDRTYRIDALCPGELQRARQVTEEFSGKSVNVAGALRLGGLRALTVVPVGEPDTARVRSMSRVPEDGLSLVPVRGRLRTNITVLEPDGRTTKINEASPALTDAEWAALLAATEHALNGQDGAWLAVCGSFPDGCGAAHVDELAALLRRLRDAGVRVAVDTSGGSLRALLHAGPVELVKPNAHELAELTGRRLRTLGDVLDSLGADGALVVTAERQYWARARARVVNTAGAGDATLAGFLHALAGARPLELSGALCRAVAWGALSVAEPSTLLSRLDDAPDVELVRSFDPGRQLTEPAG